MKNIYLEINAFALSGRTYPIPPKPRAMPWARCFWAFSPYLAKLPKAEFSHSSNRII